MANKYGTGPTLALERVRQFIETPEVATPWEVSRIAQHLIDTLTVCGLNHATIEGQRAHIEDLEAKLASLGPKKVQAPTRTAHEVEVEARGVES